MNRLNQLLPLCFLSFFAAAIGCTIDFTFRDAGTDSGSDADTCTGRNESAYRGHCYRSVSALADFDAAESSCVAWGGHLTSIANEQEKYYLLAIMSDDIWIGLHFDGDLFVFTDGSPLTYENWDGREPGGGEDCAQMAFNNGRWYNKPCSDEYGFVCKRPM
ncbi:MAG: C-type lectin domain-containing protein [Proteobacteria bacterium]|nr:C-type lectin domain-containing protein [Pseudomonadota bacterium]